MAKETVQAVRDAELKAVQLEKEAAKKYDALLINAQEEAKLTVSSMTKDAITKAKLNLEQAQCLGVELMEAAVKRAEQEIRLLTEMVKGREQAAIEIVLSEVF